MRNLINRLDAICHPFPGTHVLGLISSVFPITSLAVWPTVGETGDQAARIMPIPALAKTLKTNQQLAPMSEPFVIRTGTGTGRRFAFTTVQSPESQTTAITYSYSS